MIFSVGQRCYDGTQLNTTEFMICRRALNHNFIWNHVAKFLLWDTAERYKNSEMVFSGVLPSHTAKYFLKEGAAEIGRRPGTSAQIVLKSFF